MANCHKRRFRTELDAKIALFNTSRKEKEKRKEKRYYYCRPCRAYHLTSKEKREKHG